MLAIVEPVLAPSLDRFFGHSYPWLEWSQESAVEDEYG